MLLVLVTILIFGCVPITGNIISEKSDRAVEIYFCPKDDCGKILEKSIRDSVASVHCALYDLDLMNVIDALSKKSKSADVKVIMDNENDDGQVKGTAIKFDDNGQLMHNKFCIMDGSVIITGSFNPTENDNSYNNNNIIILNSKILAGNYEDEFEELWNGKFGKGNRIKNQKIYLNGVKIENFFCPEDGCASVIAGLIKNSKRSVYFMTFAFTNEEIADSIIKKGSLDVRGIFDSGQSSNRYSQFKRLQEFGINVKKDKNRHKLHHKVFIIDNRTVVTGSFNPTLSADTKNDENMLVITDEKIAGLFLNEFESLWP
ncbi:hypothetical protein HY637_00530 [Candidatus Woesearchaeota archaeon]|nr:hypothetical protein [Candidatus Woesearchaeota archaeon]